MHFLSNKKLNEIRSIVVQVIVIAHSQPLFSVKEKVQRGVVTITFSTVQNCGGIPPTINSNFEIKKEKKQTTNSLVYLHISHDRAFLNNLLKSLP